MIKRISYIAMNIICAYPVNLDLVLDVDEGKLSSFIRSANPEHIKSELKDSIRSQEDLISSLLYCMQNGSGAEVLIQSGTLARQIESSFSWNYRLGGNAGIMANLLADLGAQPVLNAPALEPRLAALLHSGVSVPVAGELLQPKKAAEEMKMSPEAVHFVFQFKEGDSATTPEGRITAPRDNRFIATYDPVNTGLVTRKDFDSYCLENIRNFDGALISGFHLAPLDKYREVIPPRIEQIKTWKQINPGIYIHMEMGSFQSPKIAKYFLGLLSRIPVDSLGLNEDELEVAAGEYSATSSGRSSAVAGISQWQERLEKAAWLQDHLGLYRVSVHAREYILSVMEVGKLTPQDELIALQRGADAAAALAATGSAKGEPPREVNPSGLKARDEFCRNGAEAASRGVFLQKDGKILSLMPALLAREPKITVGLGDTATAAVFQEELKAIRSHP